MVRPIPPESVLSTWPQPNFTDPQDHGPGLQIIAVVLFALVVIVVSLRIYVRAVLLRTFGIDDWFMAICLVCHAVPIDASSNPG